MKAISPFAESANQRPGETTEVGHLLVLARVLEELEDRVASLAANDLVALAESAAAQNKARHELETRIGELADQSSALSDLVDNLKAEFQSLNKRVDNDLQGLSRSIETLRSSLKKSNAATQKKLSAMDEALRDIKSPRYWVGAAWRRLRSVFRGA